MGNLALATISGDRTLDRGESVWMHRHLREHNNVRARLAKHLNDAGRAGAELAGSRVVPIPAVGLKELDVDVVWKLSNWRETDDWDPRVVDGTQGSWVEHPV